MNPTLLTVLVLLGTIFLVIWLLVRLHDRDAKRDAEKNLMNRRQGVQPCRHLKDHLNFKSDI